MGLVGNFHQPCGKLVLSNCCWRQWALLTSMGVGNGLWGTLVPLDFEIWRFSVTCSAKKGRFLSFKKEKLNFTTFDPLEKSLWLPLGEAANGQTPGKKSFRRSCLRRIFMQTRKDYKVSNSSLKVTSAPCDVILFSVKIPSFFMLPCNIPQTLNVGLTKNVLTYWRVLVIFQVGKLCELSSFLALFWRKN